MHVFRTVTNCDPVDEVTVVPRLRQIEGELNTVVFTAEHAHRLVGLVERMRSYESCKLRRLALEIKTDAPSKSRNRAIRDT